MTWNVRIGVNPLSWMNDDLPSLGGETPLETALAEGKEIGYEGFELGNKFPKDGPGLKAKLDDFGLACVSGWYSGELAQGTVEAEIEHCHAHMDKLRFNGVQGGGLRRGRGLGAGPDRHPRCRCARGSPTTRRGRPMPSA